MVNLKLKKSLAKENYVNQLVIKGTCQVKEIVDYEKHKFDSQLIQDLMNFIESEISDGKYSKKDKDFDKSNILQDILISVFGDLSETELKWLENTIQRIIDNKLVKKTLF
jgi:hypothetical protein